MTKLRADRFALLACCLLAAACGRSETPPVATPTVTMPGSAVAGRPTEVAYRFAVAADAPAFAEDYFVFVHAMDSLGRRIWTADHQPPTPTTQWKAGSVVEYRQPMLVPSGAKGTMTLQAGLYSPRTQERLTLSGTDDGSRAYKVGELTVTEDPAGPSVIFADGFFPGESPEDAQGVQWHWSQRAGTFWVRNPRQDGVMVIDVDQPVTTVGGPQQVTLALGNSVLDTFTLKGGARETRRVPFSAAAVGVPDLFRVTLSVDRTFVPAKMGAGSDTRELGVRVFGVYLDPPAP